MAEDTMVKTLKFGKMPEGKTALFMCDLQEKFRPAMFHFTDVVSNAKKLVSSFVHTVLIQSQIFFYFY